MSKLWKTQRKEYSCWAQMLNRCRSPKHPQYKYWGGKGIRVCDRWLDFDNFFEDMGNKPTGKYSIDRIDSNGNYEPSNCRWATDVEQNNNLKTNILLTHNGKTQTLAQWGREIGISYEMIRTRHRYGWDTKSIITTPKNKHHNKLI